MPPKGTKPTNDELLAQFDDLGIDTTGKSSEQTSAPPTTTTTKPASTEPSTTAVVKDPLAELENLASQRPSTPRLSAEARRPKPSSGRTSEEKPPTQPHAAAVEDEQQAEKAPVVPPQEETKSSGGGWWGGFLSTATATATAAMKQAEAAVKEIQKNEEAQKWAEQVRGNVGALRGLGGELRTLALPTFTSIIHTLAPPISSHERLQIHITHDLSGYPSLEPIIHSVFARVMSQVEGGDLLVIQRGQESAPRRGTDFGFQSSITGWRDGPWWRTITPGTPRSIAAVPGVVPGTKLARASAEAYATEFYSLRGGLEEAAKQATEVLSESNPVRSSDIFLAIQAISQITPKDLFQAGPTAEKSTSESAGGVVEIAEEDEEEILFAVYLHDPVHGIAFSTISQTIPRKWIDWLDASAPASDDDTRTKIPEAIQDIIESGGVDPREWVSEWLEESLSLSTGVVAQRYVARRMGVGEGGTAKGKLRAEQATTIEGGAGEAARTLI
ncbi:conserved hypothetical protein [Talaromyces stipitatus ATCC 10500]|uniref:Maintenance of telomere capping protein 1 n=1 Tax=Talaromyces stipitatus (strain ATCC 10500 / CBS 375.48 / QM 6759 / NRRL 1006) TaxID=441959 RepID=B8MFF0_TALSN|nr:uncharacterized protein TSTA_017580 [Talaromyces stipitatus ATCC 10500]EED16684.1 conserved hypothetical protein [Talaromyces stipitatus ATCC 10500]